jgi:hypothetical protein
MSRNFIWWLVELFIWYLFFYIALFAVKNPVSIAWVSLLLVLLGSLGLFASPLTRHLSIWNKILDKIVKKEEEKMNY